jgi:nucleoside-diphosphate-sugar epimerase
MKFLVTGGTGFIGRYFVHELSSRGHQIVAFDLFPFEEGFPKLDLSNVDYVEGDLRDQALLTSSSADCDAVLHLAAAHHDFGISESTFDTVNVGGAQSLCNAMNSNGISNACFFSTVAIYGEAKPPVSEDAPTNAVSPYGKTKLRAEDVFRNWVDGGNENQCLVIRPTVTFGIGNFANMFTLIQQIEKGRYFPVGDGTNIKSLSYVENIVEATLKLWLTPQPDQPAFAPFNYVCKPDMSSGEIAEIIYQALGKKQPGFKVPYWFARLLAFPLDVVIAITRKNLPVSGARIKKMAKAQTQYESRAIRDAGFEQKISLREGIERMVHWYVESGKEEAQKGFKRRLPPESPAIEK